MPVDPISVTGVALAVAGPAAQGIDVVRDLKQASRDVDSAVEAIKTYEGNLGTLIKRQREHRGLLAERRDEDARVNEVIEKAWASMKKAKPVLERNGPDPMSRRMGMRRRFAWRFSGRKEFKRLLGEIQRNDVEVRERIKSLELAAEFGRSQGLADMELRRRQVDEREAEGLRVLDLAMGY